MIYSNIWRDKKPNVIETRRKISFYHISNLFLHFLIYSGNKSTGDINVVEIQTLKPVSTREKQDVLN